MDQALRIILPAYLAAFFLVALLWRSYLVWKRTGINPYVVRKSSRPIDFVEAYYGVPVVLILFTTFAYAIFPGVYQFATPIAWLDVDAIKIVGLILMFAALVWIAVAQMQMGKSWRIGIDDQNKTELIETGLFSISRNPIFLGMRTALWGLFLALPNAFTLVAVVMTDILMQMQVRLEEEFLTGVHGEAYQAFRARVRRWI